MDNFQIRRLRVEDAEEICRIYTAITRRPVEPDFKSVVEEHAQSGEEACFVAEHQGKVVGFMISYILTAGFGEAKSAWIATLGVDPNFMGQGIGAGMAQEIFEIYKSASIENVYTTVRWDSTDLLSFFKTLGFDRSNFINLRKVIE
ncbi:MAG: GNAT family N-acetyltransferase [Desulfobacterales bacterium]